MIVFQSVSPVSTVEPQGLRLRDPTLRTDIRLIHTSTACRDIDQAAKYIGAGAATVGVAGSGIITDEEWSTNSVLIPYITSFHLLQIYWPTVVCHCPSIGFFS